MAKTKVVTVHHGATPQNPTGKTDPLAVQAKAATDLRYAPELSALNLLLAQAGQTYQQGKGQAQSAANSIVAATNQAAPGLADFLQRAGQRQSSVLGQVGAGSQPRLASEAAIAAQNHGLDVQSAAAQLAREKVRAAEAGAYQAKRLYGDYSNQVSQIQQRGTDLSKEAGMYASQLYQGSVADAAKAQAQAEKDARNRLTQRLIAGVDLQGQTIPGSPKAQQLQNTADATAAAQATRTAAAKAKKDAAARTAWLTPLQQNQMIGDIKTVAGLVKGQIGAVVPPDGKDKNGDPVPAIVLPDGTALKAGSKLTTTAIRALLTTTHNPLGKAFDPAVINAAFDLAVKGGLSKTNVDALHGARVKVKGRLPTVAGGAKPPTRAPAKVKFW